MRQNFPNNVTTTPASIPRNGVNWIGTGVSGKNFDCKKLVQKIQNHHRQSIYRKLQILFFTTEQHEYRLIASQNALNVEFMFIFVEMERDPQIK